MLAALADLADLVWPRICLGCGEGGSGICAECADVRAAVRFVPGLGRVHAAASYGGAVRTAIIHYKDRRRRDLRAPLAAWLTVAVGAARAEITDGSAPGLIAVGPGPPPGAGRPLGTGPALGAGPAPRASRVLGAGPPSETRSSQRVDAPEGTRPSQRVGALFRIGSPARIGLLSRSCRPPPLDRASAGSVLVPVPLGQPVPEPVPVPVPVALPVLVPVPSTGRAARERGGDHMRRLAASAARRHGLRADAVLRVGRSIDDAAGLGAAARTANVAGAYVCLRPALAGAGPVILVDDVITTGASLREAARCLSAAGYRVRAFAVIALVPAHQRVGTDGRTVAR